MTPHTLFDNIWDAPTVLARPGKRCSVDKADVLEPTGDAVAAAVH